MNLKYKHVCTCIDNLLLNVKCCVSIYMYIDKEVSIGDIMNIFSMWVNNRCHIEYQFFHDDKRKERY